MGDGGPGTPRFLGGFTPGSRIAGYRLEEQIGQGGMAVVFRAQDERLERQVALKILAPALAADEAFRHRFIRESRSAAAADDPHIIPVFEAGDADGVLFIAMRYVPGGDVGALVKRVGPLPVARAAAIISGAASALDTAHAVGLVHRDVKPTNMLLDARAGRPDHVYLSDFGLSKGPLSTAELSGSGRFIGTLNYCAPEQIQGHRVDARTDEYALACTAFELLAGGPPFYRDEDMAVLYAQVSQPPPRLASLRSDVPPAVDEVIVRALAKAPEDRYASCGEFADALRMALGLQRYASDVATVLHQQTLDDQPDQRDQRDARRPDPGAGRPGPADPAGDVAASGDRAGAGSEPGKVFPWQRTPGADRRDDLTIRFSAAQEMAARGDHARAEEEFRLVFAARQRALGPDHPETLIAWFGVAQEMAARGDHARAEAEFRRMLPYLRRSLGPEHPDTLATRCSIAREMAARGDHAGAEEEFRDVLAFLQLQPGLDHPVTVLLWVNIAKEMAARGDRAGAEEEFRDLLPHLKLTLGADHPDTLEVLEWIDYLQGKKGERPAEPGQSPAGGSPAAGRHAAPRAHPGERDPGRAGSPSSAPRAHDRHGRGSARPGAGGR
jgi:serine/threonine protein kinase